MNSHASRCKASDFVADTLNTTFLALAAGAQFEAKTVPHHLMNCLKRCSIWHRGPAEDVCRDTASKLARGLGAEKVYDDQHVSAFPLQLHSRRWCHALRQQKGVIRLPRS